MRTIQVHNTKRATCHTSLNTLSILYRGRAPRKKKINVSTISTLSAYRAGSSAAVLIIVNITVIKNIITSYSGASVAGLKIG